MQFSLSLYTVAPIVSRIRMMARRGSASKKQQLVTAGQSLAPRTVTQSNLLVQSAYTLTLTEKRIILMAASKIDSRKPAKHNMRFVVTATDFAEQWGISSNGHAYEALSEAATRLYERSIRSTEKNRRGDPVYERRWVKGRADYGDGQVTLEFNDDILPFMTLLSEQFTSYRLQAVAKLSSFHTIRLYELFAQYKTIGSRYMSLEEIRSLLDLENKYSSVKDLRRWVIDPAVAEISKTSDLLVTAEPRRDGRKVLGFQFTIGENAQSDLF